MRSQDIRDSADRKSGSAGCAAGPKLMSRPKGLSRPDRPLRDSRRDLLQPVLVMQSSENRLGYDLMTLGNAMHRQLDLWNLGFWLRNTRPQAGMRATLVVMGNPFPENATQVLLVERNQEVQTLTTNGPNQAFAESIC